MKNIPVLFRDFSDRAFSIVLLASSSLLPVEYVMFNILVWMGCKIFLRWHYESKMEAEARQYASKMDVDVNAVERISRTGRVTKVKAGSVEVDYDRPTDDGELRKVG